MIGIIGAMDIEVEFIKSKVCNSVIEVISGISFYSGEIEGKKAVVATCGIGKVNAAICAQIMIIKYNIKMLINFGVAGALSPNVKIGDVVIGNKTVQYDMDLSGLGSPKGHIPGIDVINFISSKKIVDKSIIASNEANLNIKVHLGTIATGDKFLNDDNIKHKIATEFNAIACDMETASMAHVCFVNNIEFGVIRAISDNAGNDSDIDFENFLKLAMENIAKLFDYLWNEV